MYHIQCFSCAICNQLLNKGDQFGIRSSAVYCRWVERRWSEGSVFIRTSRKRSRSATQKRFHFSNNKTLRCSCLEGYILMSQPTRQRRAPSHVPTLHQTHTVIHPTHRQVPATCPTSTAASTARTASIWRRRAPTPARSPACRSSRGRKADRANANPKISRQWHLI